LTGALIGGLVGGIVGVLAASRRSSAESDSESRLDASNLEHPEMPLEEARRSLEAKISQLNLAIDDVRQQLGSVNGKTLEIDAESREK